MIYLALSASSKRESHTLSIESVFLTYSIGTGDKDYSPPALRRVTAERIICNSAYRQGLFF